MEFNQRNRRKYQVMLLSDNKQFNEKPMAKIKIDIIQKVSVMRAPKSVGKY